MKKNLSIAICGNIASGKTSLLRILTKEWEFVSAWFENPSKNPFFDKAGEGFSTISFSSQLWFLLESIKAHSSVSQSEGISIIERIPQENALFAKKILPDNHFHVYKQCFDLLSVGVEDPSGIIYIRCSIKTLNRRSGLRSDSLQDR